MEKFVTIVDYLWARKSVYKEIIPERKLQDVKKSLKNSTFRRCSDLGFQNPTSRASSEPLLNQTRLISSSWIRSLFY